MSVSTAVPATIAPVDTANNVNDSKIAAAVISQQALQRMEDDRSALRKKNTAILQKKAADTKKKVTEELAAMGNNAIAVNKSISKLRRRIPAKSGRKPLAPPVNKKHDTRKAVVDAKAVHTARYMIELPKPTPQPEKRIASKRPEDIIEQHIVDDKAEKIPRPAEKVEKIPQPAEKMAPPMPIAYEWPPFIFDFSNGVIGQHIVGGRKKKMPRSRRVFPNSVKAGADEISCPNFSCSFGNVFERRVINGALEVAPQPFNTSETVSASVVASEDVVDCNFPTLIEDSDTSISTDGGVTPLPKRFVDEIGEVPCSDGADRTDDSLTTGESLDVVDVTEASLGSPEELSEEFKEGVGDSTAASSDAPAQESLIIDSVETEDQTSSPASPSDISDASGCASEDELQGESEDSDSASAAEATVEVFKKMPDFCITTLYVFPPIPVSVPNRALYPSRLSRDQEAALVAMHVTPPSLPSSSPKQKLTKAEKKAKKAASAEIAEVLPVVLDQDVTVGALIVDNGPPSGEELSLADGDTVFDGFTFNDKSSTIDELVVANDPPSGDELTVADEPASCVEDTTIHDLASSDNSITAEETTKSVEFTVTSSPDIPVEVLLNVTAAVDITETSPAPGIIFSSEDDLSPPTLLPLHHSIIIFLS